MNVVYKNVLVEMPKPSEASKAMYVPETEQENKRVGVVVKFGESVPEGLKKILEEKPTIEFKEYYDGAEITIAEKKYIVMHYESILIIL
jgi:co-chaperonin GroES (HSP10)